MRRRIECTIGMLPVEASHGPNYYETYIAEPRVTTMMAPKWHRAIREHVHQNCRPDL